MAAEGGANAPLAGAEFHQRVQDLLNRFRAIFIATVETVADSIEQHKVLQLVQGDEMASMWFADDPQELELVLRQHASFVGKPDLDIGKLLPLLQGERHCILFVNDCNFVGPLVQALADQWDPEKTCVLRLHQGTTELLHDQYTILDSGMERVNFVYEDVAPFDMVIRAGDTGLEASSSNVEAFRACNIPTRVNANGNLEVLAGDEGLVVARRMEIMTDPLSCLLHKLEDPFTTGIEILAAFDDVKGEWVVAPATEAIYSDNPGMLQRTASDFERTTGLDPNVVLGFMEDGEEELAFHGEG